MTKSEEGGGRARLIRGLLLRHAPVRRLGVLVCGRVGVCGRLLGRPCLGRVALCLVGLLQRRLRGA